MCPARKSRKIVESYIGEKNNVFVARKSDTVSYENKYRALEEKLIQLEPDDWPKFQKHLKKTTLG